MMRWNGIGRATDGRTSSCTSLASSSSNSKEKETGDDDGDGERKKEEQEKQKEREGLDEGGMIRKFFSTPIEAVRSFVRCWEHKLDRDGGAAEGGQWNGGSLSNSVIEVAALFQQSAAVGCVVCLNVRDDDTNSTFSFSLSKLRR